MNIQRNHILGFAGLVVFALGLYWAKAEAQATREKVFALQKEVDGHRREVRTLEAELAYQQRPDRLEATARGNMGLVPMATAKTASLSDLDSIAPLVSVGTQTPPSKAPKVEPAP